MQATASRKGKKIRNRKGRVAGLAKARRVRARKLREAKRAAAWKQTVRESKRVMKKIGEATLATTNSGATEWATFEPPVVAADGGIRQVGVSIPATGAFVLNLGADIRLERLSNGELRLFAPPSLLVNLQHFAG